MMFQVILCCASLVLLSIRGSAGQCRAGVCEDRPLCPQSPCRCLFPSPTDCALYYQYVQGKPHQYRCSSGLLFNEDTLTCDYDFNVDCSKGNTTRETELPTGEETTKIYTTNEVQFTETVTTQSSHSQPQTANTQLTETESENYSKYIGTEDMTVTDTSEKATTIFIDPTFYSFDTSPDTSYSKSSHFVLETTSPASKQSSKSASQTEMKWMTSPTSISGESDAPDAFKSTLTTEESKAHDASKSTLTTKDSEEIETPDTSKSTLTTKDSKDQEVTIFATTVKESEEIDISLKTSENGKTEITHLTSSSEQTEGPELSSIKPTITAISKAASTDSSTGVTGHSLQTEETQPGVIADGTCPFRFGLFPDENDCNKFYHCSHWKPHHKKCPSNLHFNSALKVCDRPEDAGCDLFVTSASTRNSDATNKASEITPENPTLVFTDSTDYASTSTYSESDTININYTTAMDKGLNTETTKITEQNTDKSNTEITKLNSIFIVTKDTSTTSSKFTSKNVTKDEELFSKQSSDIENEFTNSMHSDGTNTMEKDFSTLKSTIRPNSENPTYTETIMIFNNVTSATTMFSYETPATPEISTFPSTISNKSLTSSKIVSTIPEKMSTANEATTYLTTVTDESLQTTMSNRETVSTKSSLNQNNQTAEDTESYSTLSELTTANEKSINDTTKFECPERFGLYPDPDSCSKFYHCSHWIPYHKTCPSKLHFNPVLQVCDWPFRAKCRKFFSFSYSNKTYLP